MSKRLIGVIVILIIAALSVAIYMKYKNNNHNPNLIELSGNIEADDSALSFQVAGVLVERTVDEGDTVKAGQVIAKIDTIEYEQQAAMRRAELSAAEAALSELTAGTRPEKVMQAAAQMGQAQARLSELKNGARSQEREEAKNVVSSARSDLEKAEADLNLKKLELERAKSLFEQGVIPEQQYDTANTIYDVSLKTTESARIRLSSASEQLSLVEEGARTEQVEQARSSYEYASAIYKEAKNGPRKETIEQAAAKAELARQTLALAETKLTQATLISPQSGIIISKALEIGEYARPGAAVVTIANLEEVYLRAYITETELGKVKIGSKVEVSIDSYPDRKFAGVVSYISSEAEFTPKTIQTKQERVRLVYRIKVKIPNLDLILKPGMPADAVIDVEGNVR
jgi:HlyD family secretion protein